jgi:CRISPR system Cascade subunit CasE
MYLSRLTLNPHSRQVQRELGNLYQLHRTIMSGFPATLPDDERVLFRLDADPRGDELTLLIQSIHEPDWAPVINADQGRYLRVTPETPKHFQPDLPTGSLLRFRLRANPTVKKQRDDHKNGNRVPLLREDEQTAWLDRKSEQHGFRVLQVQVTGKDELSGWKKEENKSHKLQLYTAQFDGMLQVTDRERFTAAIAQGIGPAKGFGCGLLSIARER